MVLDMPYRTMDMLKAVSQEPEPKPYGANWQWFSGRKPTRP
jgi:hypothetical protein